MLLDQQLVHSTGLRGNLQDLNNSESCCLGLFLQVLLRVFVRLEGWYAWRDSWFRSNELRTTK